MNKYILFTDANCDLPADLADQLGLVVMPMKVTVNDVLYDNYLDRRELKSEDFYEMLAKGAKVSTTLAIPEDYIKYFAPLLDDGYDILNIVFSSALSGTFNSARIAAEELLERYPDRLIVNIDSKLASAGQGLLVYLAALQKQQNKTLQEVAAYTELMIPKIAAYFTVDDLHQLQRGGRISKAAANIGTLLKFKPILHIDEAGKLMPFSKERGRKKAIATLVEIMQKNTDTKAQDIVFIAHANDPEAASYLQGLVEKEFDVKKIIISSIGPVIGSHTGQGILGLIFLGRK